MSSSNIQPKHSILAIITGLITLFLLTKIYWLFCLALVMSAIGLFWRLGALYVHKAWMLISKALGLMTSTVLLSMVYFLVLFPIARLSRLFNSSKKDPLRLNGRGQSTWVNVNQKIEKELFTKPW